VLSGRRWHIVPDEMKQYLRGKYGAAPGPVSQTILERVLEGEEPIHVRPAELMTEPLEDNRDEIGAILDQLWDAGIRNVLCLRGDPPAGQFNLPPVEGGFNYANELCAFTRQRHDFCIGVAGYPEGHPWLDGEPAGKMHMHVPCSPVIEVAADCRTARGIWVAPGHETSTRASATPQAAWCWMKYDCDFIVEEGEWKIWHLRTPGIFMTPYDQPWTVSPPPLPAGQQPGPPLLEEYLPDEPPVGPNWEYAVDKVYPRDDPEVPPRYSTWTEREWPNRDNSHSEPISPLARQR
jgi:hypothetical protein